MKDDPYSLNPYNNESFQINNNIYVSWRRFIKTIDRINTKKNIPGDTSKNVLLDKYCWLLLFYGYRDKTDKRLGYDIIQENHYNNVDDKTFSHNIKTLFTFFDFNLKSFYEVWNYQHNIKRLLYQIIREEFFIGNRFSNEINTKWKSKHQLVCSPTKYDTIPLPKRHRVLDGLVFPVIVSKNNKKYKVQRLGITNFGDGDFITCNGEIIDCIRINDFWQTRNHLKQRLSFSFLADITYDEAPMIICNNMKDIKTAWRLLKANPNDGVLIRSLGENLYENYWLILNKNSAFVAMYTHTGYSMARRGTNKRGFVTLEGKHVGSLDYTYTALKKMNWLDDFDIQRFQNIVFQTENYHIGEEILKENNRYDMTPEFDFNIFDVDELMKMNDDFSWEDERP